MRFRHRDGTLVHLAYCTNVHQAEDLDGVLAQLARFGEPVRERLGVPRLGLGLWLARPVASELAGDPAAVNRLKRELAARGLEVVTLNGFPYQGFHDPVVKHKVYRPDWSTPERTRYTLDLARLLAELMPDDAVRGSVSTLPLGWRTEWRGDNGQLEVLAKGLAEQERPVRVAFEPEPGCVVETTAQAASLLSEVDKEWLGVCLDACHLAVGFEDPAAALGRLEAAGLAVVKLQASAALEAPEPADPVTRAALESFVEPRFLHQSNEGAPPGADDLDLALAGGLPGRAPWRVHFHVPLHADPAPPLTSTRPVLAATLAELFGGATARTDHVEAETYTWQVLPDAPADDTGLVAGIAAELDWTRRQLAALGLEEVTA
ncbi:metabolite traffic protein EboE [Amycolatopsis sp.]|uniref:metabolite traffic protein EboE n=1 Tax=Amycolatopsis sp. TaxID=37632 RepID=UPI002D805A49|nr:metabolite traffic protein EboE [Amycolatopsis sp.]HET6705278.1 metabolite traffic protein EboE [Amycolatopsis sp.]